MPDLQLIELMQEAEWLGCSARSIESLRVHVTHSAWAGQVLGFHYACERIVASEMGVNKTKHDEINYLFL